MFTKRLLCRWRIFCPSIAFFSERGYRGFGKSSPSFAESVTESTLGRAVLHWGWCLFLCFFGVRVGLAALSQSMLGVFWRVSTVYGQHCQQKVLVKCSFCVGWFEGCFISQRFYYRIMAASVLSRKRLLRTRGNVISKGTCWICLAIRFHSQCCARVCVDSECWRTQFFGSPLNLVGFVFEFWFCWVPTKVFSVLIVNDGDSEIVSFFGRASFVLYLRSVEDRMCA